jgi:hypothetical protein
MVDITADYLLELAVQSGRCGSHFEPMTLERAQRQLIYEAKSGALSYTLDMTGVNPHTRGAIYTYMRRAGLNVEDQGHQLHVMVPD